MKVQSSIENIANPSLLLVNALSDNDLMLAVRDGDVERLGTLFEHHHRSLYSFFLRLTHDQAQS